MKMILLTLVVCSCMAGYGQTSGGGGGSAGGGSTGGGTTGGGSSGSSGAGAAPSSGSPAVNTVGSPQNQYQSGTGAGAGVQSGTAVGSGSTRQGLPGSPVNPGLPGSPTAQGLPGSQVNAGLPGFTNSIGGVGQGTNGLRNSSGTNQLGQQNVSSGEVEQSLASLRGEIQQALTIIDSYNRSLTLRGAGSGSGVPLGNVRPGTGANLSSRTSRDFSQNLSANSGANVSTPAGAGSVEGGVGTGAGSAVGTGTSHATRIAGAAGYPQAATTTRGQVQPDSARSLLLLQADLERTLDLLGSINVPELTEAAGAAGSPQGTITGSGARVQQTLAPPGNLRIQGGTTTGASGAAAGANSTR